jgi:hypothetical protein
MTPAQLAKTGSESAHQIALFAWASVAYNHGFELAQLWLDGGNVAVDTLSEPAVPELKWIHHIPNGGSRGNDVRSQQIRGAKLKAEGVRSGVSDICLPVRRAGCSGLYIEMKRPSEKPKREGSRGGISDEQRDFGAFIQSQGFGFVVCYSWEEARDIIIAYLKS